MKNLRYICCQPAEKYYTWQVEVMINNFIKHGINPNNMDIVCSTKDSIIPTEWHKLRNKYNSVRFFFYNDTRKNPVYISSLRPHILEKHFQSHLQLVNEVIFYHDCDMIFTRPPNWDHLLNDDIWYLSNTKFYISADYIKSKGFGIYERMCEIVGIHSSVPEKYNDISSGGAQYIMKNIDHHFWKKVYEDSENLYQFFLDHLKAFPEGCLDNYHPIQKWTADMWAVLWNAWYFGHDSKVVPEMDFTWPNQSIDNWEKRVIFHNAGVNNDEEGMFFKAKYSGNKLPYDIKLEDFSEKRCSYRYVEEILETAKVSCLLDNEDIDKKNVELKDLIIKYKSDKFSNGYVPMYEKLFNPIRENEISLLEIGIGTMIPNVPSSMVHVYGESGDYKPSASLRAFRDYFPNGKIYGGDIQDDCIFTEDRIETFKFDSTELEECNKSLGNLRFDIIIDDGLHTTDAQVRTFNNLWPRVKSGGFYFIEDVHKPLYDDWQNRFSHINARKWEHSNGKWTFIVFQKLLENNILDELKK